MLDATLPDIELPVVKVIVPGLRPAWSASLLAGCTTCPSSLVGKSAPCQRAS